MALRGGRPWALATMPAQPPQAQPPGYLPSRIPSQAGRAWAAWALPSLALLQSLPPHCRAFSLRKPPRSPGPGPSLGGRCWRLVSCLPRPQAHRGLPVTPVDRVHTCEPPARE